MQKEAWEYFDRYSSRIPEYKLFSEKTVAGYRKYTEGESVSGTGQWMDDYFMSLADSEDPDLAGKGSLYLECLAMRKPAHSGTVWPASYETSWWTNMALVLFLWNRYKQAYRFHPAAYDAVRATNRSGFVPDVLANLPFRYFYVSLDETADAGGSNVDIRGAFVSVDSQDGRGKKEWVVSFMFVGDGDMLYWERCVWEDGVKQKVSAGRDGLYSVLPDSVMLAAMNCITYIAAANADIVPARRKRVNPVGRKGIPASKARIGEKDWDVGYRIGPAIEKERAMYPSGSGTNQTGRKLRPHWRAAHWQHYHVGSGAERHLELRWKEPYAVHPDGGTDLPVVERRNREYPGS